MIRLFSLSFMVFFIGLGSAVAGPSIDPAKAMGFVPHKALYDISLSSTRSGSQIANVSGQMFYEWQPTCDAWQANHRFDLLYEYHDSEPIRVTSNFSTYESFDGKTFNFTSERSNNGTVFEELRGVADVGQNQALITYSLPEDHNLEVSGPLYFPMAHTMAVVNKIAEGELYFYTTIFDGSDEEGPVDVSAFVGQEDFIKNARQNKSEVDEQLVDSRFWPVRLAFFSHETDQAEPEYEMDLILHQNSVVSDMEIEYKDFSIHQTLSALEKLPSLCVAQEK